MFFQVTTLSVAVGRTVDPLVSRTMLLPEIGQGRATWWEMAA